MTFEKQHARKYAILRSENPEAMDVVYNAGYAANYDYMTFAEAAAITNQELCPGTGAHGLFSDASAVTHLEEAVYFGIKAYGVAYGAYKGCKSMYAVAFGPGIYSLTGGGIWWGVYDVSVLTFPTTPPALGSNFISFASSHRAKFYVYDDLVDTYKAAWPDLSSNIYGFSEYSGKILYPQHYNFSA